MEDPSPGSCVTFSRGGRPPALRTTGILQLLHGRNRPLRTREIASFVGAPYNSALKTLGRLVKKGLVLRPSRGLYEFNHEAYVRDPGPFVPCMGVVSQTGVHRVGLHVEAPGLWGRLLETGNLTVVDLSHMSYYQGRSPCFDASMKIYPDRAYYQRSCPPVPLRGVALMVEDFRAGLEYLTRGLVDVGDLYVGDLETGEDVPNLFTGPLLGILSRVIIYPRGGRTRVHVQLSGLGLPAFMGPRERLILLHMQRWALEDALLTLREAWSSTCRELGGDWDPGPD